VIEIIVLFKLVRGLASMAEAKGRSQAWGGLGAALWIVGEISGFVLGAALSGGDGEGGMYVLGLFGAAAGALVAYLVVLSLPSASTAPSIEEIRDRFL
jgi:hypothetical protein